MDIAKIRKKIRQKMKEPGLLQTPEETTEALDEKPLEVDAGKAVTPIESVEPDDKEVREPVGSGHREVSHHHPEKSQDLLETPPPDEKNRIETPPLVPSPDMGIPGSEQIQSLPPLVDTTIDLLVFRLGGEEYAFKLEDVKEILKKQFITSVSLAPPSVIGITSLRGTVIPVVDLSLKVLGVPVEKKRKNRILIMEGERGTLGCMVDEIEGVQRCSLQERKEVPEQLNTDERAFIEAVFIVNGRFITLLKKEAIEIKRSGG